MQAAAYRRRDALSRAARTGQRKLRAFIHKADVQKCRATLALHSVRTWHQLVWGKILVDAGYEVRSTLNSIEAIEIAREFQPHVALLGLIMPRMDGIKSGLELMKVLPRTKVVITTESEPKDLETFRERGWTFDVLPWNSGKEELLEKTRGLGP